MLIGIGIVNVHHLELFYYVAKHEGITPAVRKMPYGIQQPAVSGQILQLEKDLGTKLFQRRPFALTPAGRDLYDFILPFFSRLDDVAAGLRGEGSQHLRLAASATVLTVHLPVVLQALKKRVPDLRLTLKEVMPADLEAVLLSQEVDVAVSLLRGEPAAPVKFVELLRLPLVLLAPPGAPCQTLAALRKSADRGEIEQPLITLPSHEWLTRLFDRELGKRDLHWTPTMEVSTLELVHSYTAHGFGYGLSAEAPLVEIPKGVKRIRLPKFKPLVVGLSYTGELKPVAQLFLEEARTYARLLSAKKR